MEEARPGRTHGDNVFVLHDAGLCRPEMALPLQLLRCHIPKQTRLRHEMQNRRNGLLAALPVHGFRIGGIEGKGVCLPDLPVVVECRRIKRTGLPHHDIGKPELLRELRVLKARLHHPDMGHEGALHVEGGKLDAHLIVLDALKDAGRNALGGFSLIIAREHAVDIRIVDGPEALLDVERGRIRTGNHQNLLPRHQLSRVLQLPQPGHEMRCRIELLIFVAPQTAQHAECLLSAAEAEALYLKISPVQGVK